MTARFAVDSAGVATELPAPVSTCPFGAALLLLKRGYRLQRVGWNGPGQFLELQRPDAGSKMTVPYIYITTVQGDRVPWLPSQTDVLAEDWRVAR